MTASVTRLLSLYETHKTSHIIGTELGDKSHDVATLEDSKRVRPFCLQVPRSDFAVSTSASCPITSWSDGGTNAMASVLAGIKTGHFVNLRICGFSRLTRDSTGGRSLCLQLSRSNFAVSMPVSCPITCRSDSAPVPWHQLRLARTSGIERKSPSCAYSDGSASVKCLRSTALELLQTNQSLDKELRETNNPYPRHYHRKARIRPTGCSQKAALPAYSTLSSAKEMKIIRKGNVLKPTPKHKAFWLGLTILCGFLGYAAIALLDWKSAGAICGFFSSASCG